MKWIKQYYFTVERFFYIILVLLFVFDFILKLMPTYFYKVLFISILGYFVIQQILFETVLYRYDGAFHYKGSKKHFVQTKETSSKSVSRKGIKTVIFVYMLYLCALFYLTKEHLLSWPIFMSGGCAVLLLNNIFIHIKCPIQTYILRDVTCCANCHISAWDYYIFSSGLIFAPISGCLQYFCFVLCVLSFVRLFYWERSVYKHPERFSAKTNKAVLCVNCTKRCTVSKKKYKKVH